MSTREMQQYMERVRSYLEKTDATQDRDLGQACLLYAMSLMADVLDNLIAQAEPDTAKGGASMSKFFGGVYSWDQETPEYSDIEIVSTMDDGVDYPIGAAFNADTFACLSDDDADEADRTARATAQLWCAAPDLLAACKAAREWFERRGYAKDIDAYNQLVAAIAQAEPDTTQAA